MVKVAKVTGGAEWRATGQLELTGVEGKIQRWKEKMLTSSRFKSWRCSHRDASAGSILVMGPVSVEPEPPVVP